MKEIWLNENAIIQIYNILITKSILKKEFNRMINHYRIRLL